MTTNIAFFEAVRDDDLDTVRQFLSDNPALANGRMPGDSSILNFQVWLDRKRVPITDKDERFGTALHYAAIWGKLQLAKLLLEFGADVNAIAYENNHEQTSPIVLAAWEGGLDMMKLLLEHGADPNSKSSNGVTPLSTSRRHNRNDRVELLLQY